MADEVLDGKYIWTTAAGWWAYDGRRWQACSKEAAIEAVRQYTLDRYADAASGIRDGSTAE